MPITPRRFPGTTRNGCARPAAQSYFAPSRLCLGFSLYMSIDPVIERLGCLANRAYRPSSFVKSMEIWLCAPVRRWLINASLSTYPGCPACTKRRSMSGLDKYRGTSISFSKDHIHFKLPAVVSLSRRHTAVAAVKET